MSGGHVCPASFQRQHPTPLLHRLGDVTRVVMERPVWCVGLGGFRIPSQVAVSHVLLCLFSCTSSNSAYPPLSGLALFLHRQIFPVTPDPIPSFQTSLITDYFEIKLLSRTMFLLATFRQTPVPTSGTDQPTPRKASIWWNVSTCLWCH